MSKWVDPGFIHHQAIGRLWAGHAMVVADSNLLPINLYAFTKQVKVYLTKFQTAYKDMLNAEGITLGKKNIFIIYKTTLLNILFKAVFFFFSV